MRKVALSKIKLALIATLFAIVLSMVGIMTFAKAEASVTSVYDVQDTFQMDGANLIVEGEGGINGLNFTASMSADDYEGLMALVGEDKTYTSIETGLIIMPAYYEDTYGWIWNDTLFGEEAIYDWAEYTNGQYVYSGDKIRVVNINANDWSKAGDKYTYDGAIVDLYDHNETVAFVSTAYIRVVDANGVEAVAMANMSIATSVAFELEEEYSSMTGEQKAWVDANWTKFEAVKGEDVIVDATGLDSINVFPMDEETPAILANISLDEEAIIKIGMIDPTGVRFTDAFGKKIEFNMNELTEVPVIDLTDGSNLREWTFDMLVGDIVVYTVKIDIVDYSRMPDWNDLASTKAFEPYYPSFNTMRTTEAQSTTFDGKDVIEVTELIGHNGKAPGELFMTVAPSHSKAFYESLRGQGFELKYSYYWEVDPNYNPGKKPNSDSLYYIINQYGHYAKGSRPTGGATGSAGVFNKWHNVSLKLDTVLDNWDNIVNVGEATYKWGGSDTLGMFYAMTTDWNALGGMKAMGLKLYMAGFDVVLDPYADVVDGGDILVKLDDVADLTSLDLTSYMKPSDVELIQSASNLTYEMKGYAIADTIKVTDLTKVDVSNAKEAAYELAVKSGVKVLYTATIDIYNTASAVVWAEELTPYNLVIRKSANTTGAYYTETIESTGTVPYELVDSVSTSSATYKGSYAKFTLTEAMNLAFDVKALHTKAYYNEMIGDSTKILQLKAWSEKSLPYVQTLCGRNNYGMWNAYMVKDRFGLQGTYDSIVMSLDNNFLATSKADTYHGYYYDYWETVEGTNLGMCRPMATFEITNSLITNNNGSYVLCVGFESDKTMIVDASETLALAKNISGATIDLSTETSYDLGQLIPAVSQAKYKAMAKAWAGKNGKTFKGNAIGFQLTINGQTHCVVPDANGVALLNLDDYIVGTNKVASTETMVRDLLTDGENTVKIIAYGPPVTYMGLSGHQVKLFDTSTITVIGPAKELAIDLASINLTEAKFTIDAMAEAHDFTSKISAENQAVLQEIKDAGYELTYVLSYDDQGATVSLTEAEAKNATHEDYTRWQYPDVNYTLEIRVIVDESTSFTVLTGTFEAVYE